MKNKGAIWTRERLRALGVALVIAFISPVLIPFEFMGPAGRVGFSEHVLVNHLLHEFWKCFGLISTACAVSCILEPSSKKVFWLMVGFEFLSVACAVVARFQLV
jgi:hypothetical protein